MYPWLPRAYCRLYPRRLDIPGFAVGSLALLAAGLLLPVVTLDTLGPSCESYSIIAGIVSLSRKGEVLLALIIFAFSVAFPLYKIVALLVIWFRPLHRASRAHTLHLLKLLGKWSMLDVFVVVVLVGSVQLGILAEAEVEPGVYVFAGSVFLSMVANLLLERLVGTPEPAPQHWRPRVPVLALAALALLMLGLVLPVMKLEEWFFWDNDYSVVQGMVGLYQTGDWLLATAVALFVIAIPVAKFAALFIISVRRRGGGGRGMRLLLHLDKWSMLDVFGLAVLVVLAKVGGLANVKPQIGLWFLGGAALISVYLSWVVHHAE